MLLQALKDADEVREPEAAAIKRKKHLCTKVPNHRIAQVIQPVIIIRVAGQGMLGPVVVGVDLLPEPWHHMQGPVHPIHPEGHQVVVGHQPHSAFPQRRGHRAGRVVAGDGVVQPHIEGKLAD